jgi:hypothetical protein
MFILPGLIYRRFYYIGEFSKQFSVSEPVLRTIIHAIIPSIILQFVALIFFEVTNSTNFDIGEGVDFHKRLIDPEYYFSENGDTETIKQFIFNKFLGYSLLLYGMAVAGGLLFHFINRKLKLDIRFKILRFKNQWAYIFSGEVLKFTKLRKHKLSIDVEEKKKNSETLLAYVDVISNKNNNDSIMYSGLIVDYDISSENLSVLDKIYLAEAHRHERSDGSRYDKPKRIPGKILVLLGSEIRNLNVTYVIREEQKSDPIRKVEKIKDIVLLIIIYLISVISIASLPFFLIYMPFIHLDIYNDLFGLNVFNRIYIWYILMYLFNGLTFFSIDEKNLKKVKYENKEKLKNNLKTFFVIILLYLLVFWPNEIWNWVVSLI